MERFLPLFAQLVRAIGLPSFVLAFLITLLSARPAAAQMGQGNGFLFRVPTLRLELTGGYAQPRAQSDIFDFVTSKLTLNRGDFGAPGIAAAATVRVAPRVVIGLSSSFAGRGANSEYRHFTGEDDLPIKQTTTLQRVTLMAIGRASLIAPGHSVGRYAWIPNRIVPFVGGGAGGVWYKLRQMGEFVDDKTLDIFPDTFESNGWSFGATGFGGADVSLTARVGLTGQAHYLWARAPMNGDFHTFNKIDLSGYDASIGFYVRF